MSNRNKPKKARSAEPKAHATVNQRTLSGVLKRSPLLDTAIDQLRSWAKELIQKEYVDRAWLFGSAVNDGGVRFQHESSDLDVLVLVQWESLSPSDRLNALRQLKESKLNLEQLLLCTFQRNLASEQIVSLVPITEWEIGRFIHKDGNDAIIRNVPMLDLDSNELQSSLACASPIPDGFPTAHRQAAQFVQKTRAKFLSVSANALSKFSIDAHQDPVPKELLRLFAIATTDLGSDEDQADLSRGLHELSMAVAEHRNTASEEPMGRYAEWLHVRQGARGQIDPVISPEAYVLTTELIFDRITQQYNSDSSIRVIAPAARGAAKVKPLAARFLVTYKGTLGRTVKDNVRAIANARANMTANAHPAFELEFETSPEEERLLSAPDSALSDSEHSKKLKLFDRRSKMTVHQEELTSGITLLLWYGGTLLPNGNGRELHRDLERATRAWVAQYMSYGKSVYAGSRDAWHGDLYPAYPAAFGFSNRFTQKSAADDGVIPSSGHVSDLPRQAVATSFVPNLISVWLNRAADFAELPPTHKDLFFTSSNWLYGPH